jgi:hypothetical protein
MIWMTGIPAARAGEQVFWGFGLNNSYVHATAGHGNVSLFPGR